MEIMMPNDDKSRHASGHVEAEEDPDESLRRELRDYEVPEQRAHERSWFIGERLRLELPRLTDLARVPPESIKRDYFRRAVLHVVLDAWDNYDLREAASQLRTKKAALSRVVAKLRSAKRAFVDLDKHDREALRGPISEVESQIDLLLEWMLGEPEPVKPQAHRRGRTAGTIKNRIFITFVGGLLWAAETCGRELTLDKRHPPAGTLIEAIKILTPCLPDGFVPKALPGSTLQRIKSKRTKRRP
jgi:hypothetical protein